MLGVSSFAFRRQSKACSIPALFAAAVVTASFGLCSTPATARSYFYPFFFPDRPQAETRYWPTHRRLHSAKAKSAPRQESKRSESGSLERPLFAVISIADQHVSIYNHNGLVDRSAISTGMPGHPTPKGVFTIIGRERFHNSNIYSGAPMPFMQRITWSGIAMHLGVVPGHPASHGCIRLPAAFAAKLWGMTRIGERVVISPRETTPVEFAHPLLPTPKMQAQTVAESAAPASDAPQASDVAAPPPMINPRQYAEQLKVKSASQATAALKAVKERSEAVGAKRQDVARASLELRAAEAAHASLQMKVDAAAAAFEIAAASAVRIKERSALQLADLKPGDGDAEAARVARAYERAEVAKAAAASARAEAETALAAASTRLTTANTAFGAASAEFDDAVRLLSEANDASAAAAKAEKEAQMRLTPVSVLISKKDRRIYVRQGLAPLFDAPATVRDPERPLGSHLYIATSVEGDGRSLKWSVVSLPARGGDDRGDARRKTASLDEQLGASTKALESTSGPAAALERIEIDQETRDRIAERLWTGGSLIVSDQPLSGETGAVGTDLTVKIH